MVKHGPVLHKCVKLLHFSKLSIFYVLLLLHSWLRVLLKPIPPLSYGNSRSTPGQVTSLLQSHMKRQAISINSIVIHTRTHSYGQFIVPNSPYVLVFGLWATF